MMATDLYILAALVALLSVTNSLPDEDNRLNKRLSKTKPNRKKSSSIFDDDVDKASESIKLNRKGSSFFHAVLPVGSEETDFKQIKKEEKKKNLSDEDRNLRKWLQDVLDLVRKLDIENLVGITNDKGLPNNTTPRVFIDKATEPKEESKKAKFFEIYPIVYVPEIENKQIAERSKLRSLFSSSSSPTLKKRSSKMRYNFERYFDEDSLESYEKEDPCDYENNETDSGFQKAVINSKNIKHKVTKTTNPANRHKSANERTTKLSTKAKLLEQDKNSTPTLKYIQTNKIGPHPEVTINNVTFEKLPDSSYVTPNSSITSIIQHSPAEESLNKIPTSNESTSQYLTTPSKNIQNSPVEGILNKIPDDEQNKLQYYVPSLGFIQNSPIESILNKIPSDDLNKSQYLISSPNNIQNLPVKGVINNNPGEEQNKLQYSTPSLGAIQNSPIEEVLNQIPSENLNKSQYLIPSPKNIQNLPVEEVSNKTPSEDLTKVQNLIPSLDDIQSIPIEDEINKSKPSLGNSQNLNTGISEFIPENNIKMNDQTNFVPTTQQNPAFKSNVRQIPIKQDSTPILNFNQNIPVQYDPFRNDQESDLKSNNKSSDDNKLSLLDNKDKILEDSKHVLHFTTPYPIVIENSSNHILIEQPEIDSQNMSPPINNISSENTQSIVISKRLPKNPEPQQSSASQKPIQNLPIEKSFSTLNEKEPYTQSLSLPETRDDTDLDEENISEKLPISETPNEEYFINFSEIGSSNDFTENEDYEYIEEEIEDDSNDDDEDSYSSENDYDDANEELVNSFPKSKDDISSKNAPVQYSSSTVPTEIIKEAEISYDTFLQFLYRHSNSPFIQSLRENSTLS